MGMAEYVELGRSGVRVSIIGVGTWQWGSRSWGYGREYGAEELRAAFNAALDRGINLFDTAEIYGGGASERLLGEFMEERREEVVVATKLWPTRITREGVKKALERSLERLRTDHVDLYQVHWYNPVAPLGRLMRAMEELWMEGKVKAIGVSNFGVKELEKARSALSHTDIASNQVKYNMVEREVEEGLLPYCRREGITLIAYSPLAQGLLTGKYGPENPPRDSARRFNPLFTEEGLKKAEPLIAALKRVAERRGKTPAQVALNWLIRTPGVVAIPGVKGVRHAVEAAGAMGWRLSPEELRELEEAYKPINPSKVKVAFQLLSALFKAKR